MEWWATEVILQEMETTETICSQLQRTLNKPSPELSELVWSICSTCLTLTGGSAILIGHIARVPGRNSDLLVLISIGFTKASL